MIIMASTIANAINNVRHITQEEIVRDTIKSFPDTGIKEIIVTIALDYKQIHYTVKTKDGQTDYYNEQTVPRTVIYYINRHNPMFKMRTKDGYKHTYILD